MRYRFEGMSATVSRRNGRYLLTLRDSRSRLLRNRWFDTSDEALDEMWRIFGV